MWGCGCLRVCARLCACGLCACASFFQLVWVGHVSAYLRGAAMYGGSGSYCRCHSRKCLMLCATRGPRPTAPPRCLQRRRFLRKDESRWKRGQVDQMDCDEEACEKACESLSKEALQHRRGQVKEGGICHLTSAAPGQDPHGLEHLGVENGPAPSLCCGAAGRWERRA